MTNIFLAPESQSWLVFSFQEIVSLGTPINPFFWPWLSPIWDGSREKYFIKKDYSCLTLSLILISGNRKKKGNKNDHLSKNFKKEWKMNEVCGELD